MLIIVLLIFSLINVFAVDKLLNVQAIWRHGARTPVFCIWNCTESDTDVDANRAPLTPAGMRQQYVLGKWLRQRYIIDNEFLSTTFNENEVYIESSDINRTLQSAYSQLQGMYPQGPLVPDVNEDKLLPPNKGSITPGEIGKNALPNQISLIPIHTKEFETDYAIAIYCPKQFDFVIENIQTDLTKSVDAAGQQLYKDFNTQMKLTGEMAVDNIFVLFMWRDTFICARHNGIKLPEELKEETLEQMDKIALLASSLAQFQTWEQSKLFSTPYFKQLIDNFDSYLNGSSHFKYRGTSSHDNTLIGLLSGLNLTSAECQANIYLGKNSTVKTCITTYVEFASNLIFELYNNTISGPYVKILYNGEYMPICSDIGTTCKYSTFRQLILAQQVDYKKQCNIPDDMEIPIEEKTPGWATAFFVIIIILMLSSGAITFFLLNKLKSRAEMYE